MLWASTVVLFCLAANAATAQGFSVSTGTGAVTIHPGDQGITVPVTVGALAGFVGPVSVTVTGLPSGITVTPATLAPGSSGVVQLSASVSAAQEDFPANALPAPNTATSTVQVVAIAGTNQASTPLALTVSLTNPTFVPIKMNLPIVRIDTGGAPITSTAVDVPGSITIASADGSTSYLPNSEDSDTSAVFHVHGHSTALMPKLPYEMKLGTSLDLLTQMGLKCSYVTSSGTSTCDKGKTYVLLANYDDKTLLRDWSGSTLANLIPYGGSYLSPTPLPSSYKGKIPTPSGTTADLPWAPHSLFVELFLNGTYQGVYQLSEKVSVDSHRVDIPELTQTQVSGDLSGGYLLEIDHHEAEDFVFFTPQGLPIGLLDPDFTPEVPEQTSYISNYVTGAENALMSPTFTDPTTGWRAYFDEASAVNFYIVNEVMGNVDAGDFYSSNFLYKAPDNPFLYMGPVWDFDISAGNVNYYPIASPTVPWITSQAPWYEQWFQDPGFKSAARQQWNALKSNGVLTAWTNSIATEAATLQQAQANNNGRWPMQGIMVWPNSEAAGSYSGELNFLLDWVSVRMGFMDAFLNGTPPTTTSLALSATTEAASAPVVLTATVQGKSPTGTVTFTYNGIVFGQSALTASGTATLNTSSIPPGSWSVGAIYNGDDHNALSTSPSATLTVQPVQIQTVTNLSSSTASTSYGSPIILTAVVAGTQGSGSPTGTVSFSANGVLLGAASVTTGGVASLTTTQLPGGQAALSATYAGDSTYAASTSNADAVSVATTFTLTSNAPASATLAPGSSVQYQFSLAPVGGFYPGDVTLATTGAPSSVSCALSQTTVSAGAGPEEISMTCGYKTGSAAVRSPAKAIGIALCGLLFLPISMCTKRTRSFPVIAMVLLIVCTGTLLTGLAGCGSSSTRMQSYYVGVAASSGTVQQSTSVLLNIP